jgi:hypothetical protein
MISNLFPHLREEIFNRVLAAQGTIFELFLETIIQINLERLCEIEITTGEEC